MRYKSSCNIISGGKNLEWASEIKYLRIFIEKAIEFTSNYTENRNKFFRAFNCIFGRVGRSNIAVIVHLMSTQCLPILIYGCEVTRLSKYDCSRIRNSYDFAFMKIFATTDIAIIRSCQFYLGILPLKYQLDICKYTFLKKTVAYHNEQPNVVLCQSSNQELVNNINNIVKKYGLYSDESTKTTIKQISAHFKMHVIDSGYIV